MTTSAGARLDRHTAILWRRLDVPGHDSAILVDGTDGMEIRGVAVFHDAEGATGIAYSVRCDTRWLTIGARVSGWQGTRPINLEITRDALNQWKLNGVPCPAIAGCLDVDLSFTPATNLLPLRRLNLPVGEAAEVHAAWLTWPDATLQLLKQRYTHRSATAYEYEAELPDNQIFSTTLRVDPNGWVHDYPGLWQVEES